MDASTPTQADDTTYEFDYTLDGAGKVIQTLVTYRPVRATRHIQHYRLLHADTRPSVSRRSDRSRSCGRQGHLPPASTTVLAPDRYESTRSHVESVTPLAGTGDM